MALVKYLKGCGGVSAFVVVTKPPRLDDNFNKMLHNLGEMMGRDFWAHLIFVVTHLKVNCAEAVGDDEQEQDVKEDSDGSSDSDDEDLLEDLTPDQWLNDFALMLRGKLELEKKPICIGVENRNINSYQKAIADLIANIPETKFECDRI